MLNYNSKKIDIYCFQVGQFKSIRPIIRKLSEFSRKYNINSMKSYLTKNVKP